MNTLLEQTGRALYGDEWLARLEDDLDVSRRTMGRWLSGRDEVPAGVWRELFDLVRTQADPLNAVLPQLERAAAGERPTP